MDSLQHWMEQARVHWREFQPSLYRQATAAGTLDALLLDAAQLTEREMAQVEAAGVTRQNAWEMTREAYLFPPNQSPAVAAIGSQATRDFGPFNSMTSVALRSLLEGN
jgi:hypothetical protein